MPRRAPDEPSHADSSKPSPNTRKRGADDSQRRMTARQLEILVNVARGRTNRQIGVALGISDRTVSNHMRAIMRKLESADRTRAVVVAIERGWIAIPIEPELSALPGTPVPAPRARGKEVEQGRTR